MILPALGLLALVAMTRRKKAAPVPVAIPTEALTAAQIQAEKERLVRESREIIDGSRDEYTRKPWEGA